MKKLLLLIVFYFSSSVWAVEYGTYAWTGVGCRDSSLNEDSHVTKAVSSNPVGVSYAVFNINNDGTANMHAVIDDKEQKFSDRYMEARDRIDILLSMGDQIAGTFTLNIVRDTLVIVEEDEEAAEEICGSDKKYVYVLDRVN